MTFARTRAISSSLIPVSRAVFSTSGQFSASSRCVPAREARSSPPDARAARRPRPTTRIPTAQMTPVTRTIRRKPTELLTRLSIGSERRRPKRLEFSSVSPPVTHSRRRRLGVPVDALREVLALCDRRVPLPVHKLFAQSKKGVNTPSSRRQFAGSCRFSPRNVSGATPQPRRAPFLTRTPTAVGPAAAARLHGGQTIATEHRARLVATRPRYSQVRESQLGCANGERGSIEQWTWLLSCLRLSCSRGHLRRHGWSRLPRLTPLRLPARAESPPDLRGQPGDRVAAKHRAHPRSCLHVPEPRHDRAPRDRRAGRLRLSPGRAREPDRLPTAAAPFSEGGLVWDTQRARAREVQTRALPARVHERGLRRSGAASAAGDVLGQRQPRRTARGLRRSETVCGSLDDGLSRPAGG